MDIEKKFLELTFKTYPHGTEHGLRKYLPSKLNLDSYGNYYLIIGDQPTTMFTSHLDTANRKQGFVNHVEFQKDGRRMIGTDKTSILGADCKAGVVIMMNMIEHKIPGLYYFFLGEEVGCKGSKWTSEQMEKNDLLTDLDITKVVSFDRRGTKSIITYQWAGRCASDEFANGLISEFEKQGMEMEIDPTGVCTDSIQFQDFIPECTNISVGYYNEHQPHEHQDIEFLKEIATAVLKIDWENLPVERDPSVTDYGNFYDDYYDAYNNQSDTSERTWDAEYTTLVQRNGKKHEVFISVERINREKTMIAELFEFWGLGEDLDPDGIEWDGNYVRVSWDGKNTDLISRSDLAISIPEISQVDPRDVREVIGELPY